MAQKSGTIRLFWASAGEHLPKELSALAEQNGFHVQTIKFPKTFNEPLPADTPCFLLIDFRNPKEALSYLNTLSLRKDISLPCVAVLPQNEEPLKNQALTAGAIECLPVENFASGDIRKRLLEVWSRYLALSSLQQTLREEHLLKSILQTVPKGILAADAGEQHTIFYTNARLNEWIGSAENTLLGSSLEELLKRLVPQSSPAELLAKAQKSNIRKEITSEQKIFKIQLSFLSSIDFPRGIYLFFIEDITAEKKLERRIQESEAFLNAIWNSIPDLLILMDTQGNIQNISPSVTTLLGYTPEETLGKSAFSFLHPEDVPRAQKDLMRLFQERKPFRAQYKVLAKDGRLFHFETNASLLEEDPLSGHILILARDRTEAVAAEQKIKNLLVQISEDNEKLMKLDEMKDNFLSIVSHELRTPLTSIQGYLKLLAGGLTGPLNDEQREFVHISLRNAERLYTLINDLLDLSRMESGRLPFRFQKTNAAPLLRSALESVRNLAKQKKLRLELHCPESLSDIRADAGQLERVLINLLSNAIKFTPEGGSVTLGAMENEKETLFWVRDTGIGIPPEALPRIFDKFYQVEAAATRKAAGSGLGLSICKHIVEAHGGTIAVQSQEGKGTLFEIHLPRRLPEGS